MTRHLWPTPFCFSTRIQSLNIVLVELANILSIDLQGSGEKARLHRPLFMAKFDSLWNLHLVQSCFCSKGLQLFGYLGHNLWVIACLFQGHGSWVLVQFGCEFTQCRDAWRDEHDGVHLTRVTVDAYVFRVFKVLQLGFDLMENGLNWVSFNIAMIQALPSLATHIHQTAT